MDLVSTYGPESLGNDSMPPPAGADILLQEFVRIILPPPEASKVLRGFYTEALHAVLLSRLAVLRDIEDPDRKCGVRALPKWRLRRVNDFIEANLENRISLKALAGAAGVSRMYFASQFRAATGMRPHDYVMRRRMEKAKQLLALPGSTLVDVTFSVGFQTQSHFTTAFKRHEGTTPHRWRALQGVHGAVALGQSGRDDSAGLYAS